MKEPIGRFSILQTGAGATDGIGDRDDRLVLADDALHEALFHFHELLALAFLQARDRDARPARDDLGDVFLGDFLAQEARFLVGRFFRCDLAQLFLELGNAAVLDLARRPSSPRRCARSSSVRAVSSSSFTFACASMPTFSFCHSAFIAADCSFSSASSFSSFVQALLARRDLFLSSAPVAPSRAA